MELKETIDKIIKIEQQCDINAVLYKDMKVWPLIRLFISSQLWHPELEIIKSQENNFPIVVTSVPDNILYKSRRILSQAKKTLTNYYHLYYYYKEMKKISHSNQIDLLFFSTDRNYTNIFGKYYNIYLDSMIEFINNRYNLMKVEIGSEHNAATLPRYIDTIFLDSSHFNIMKRDKLAANYPDNIINFMKLKKVVEENTDGKIILNEKYFVNIAQLVEEHQCYYSELLSRLSPKVVFVMCYFTPVVMAFIRAARQLGIKSVDIQHGCQGPHHSLYSQWTKIPAEGYDLIPDFFWVWGEKSKENILRGQPNGCRHHQPVVGGNLWLAKYQQKAGYPESPQVREFFDSLKKYRKVILFTLQPLAEPIPAHVLEAMRRSPQDWLWLIRAHPLYKSELPKIEKLLHQNNIDNFETKMSSDFPLYLIFQGIDHHITCGSSCGFEAITFDIPNTIIDRNYAVDQADYISKGLFSCCLNADDLLATIENSDKRQKIDEGIPYIETDYDKANQALEYIISR
jgi:hypothetical protein